MNKSSGRFALAVAGFALCLAGTAHGSDVPALKVDRSANAQKSIEAAARSAAETPATSTRLIASLPGSATDNASYLDRMVVATRDTRGRTLLRRMLLRNADTLALLNQEEPFLAAWVEQRARRIERATESCDDSSATLTPDELRDQIETEGSVRRLAGLATQAPAGNAQDIEQSIAVVKRSLTAEQRAALEAGGRSGTPAQRCRAELVWARAVLAAPEPHRLRLLRAHLLDQARDPAVTIDEIDLADATRLLAALAAPPPAAYPPVAAAIGAEAVLKVAVRVEPSGVAKAASVASRQVSVPGLVGLEPLIFERWFDEASIQAALKRRYEARSTSGAPAPYTVEVDIPWQLRR
ncbi:MAG: hypothetical protein U5L03_14995 [Burkholderiaceae bacterium]|nr:hypothetical protein [Burkholderiaceae bacterium]